MYIYDQESSIETGRVIGPPPCMPPVPIDPRPPVYDQRQGAPEPLDFKVDIPEEQDVAVILFGPSPVRIIEENVYDIVEFMLLDEIAF